MLLRMHDLPQISYFQKALQEADEVKVPNHISCYFRPDSLAQLPELQNIISSGRRVPIHPGS
jgi:hypothetical protein